MCTLSIREFVVSSDALHISSNVCPGISFPGIFYALREMLQGNYAQDEERIISLGIAFSSVLPNQQQKRSPANVGAIILTLNDTGV